ncbi:hypothetical protein FOL47_007304, partial [Perkinsus chesapeaki]
DKYLVYCFARLSWLQFYGTAARVIKQTWSEIIANKPDSYLLKSIIEKYIDDEVSPSSQLPRLSYTGIAMNWLASYSASPMERLSLSIITHGLKKDYSLPSEEPAIVKKGIRAKKPAPWHGENCILRVPENMLNGDIVYLQLSFDAEHVFVGSTFAGREYNMPTSKNVTKVVKTAIRASRKPQTCGKIFNVLVWSMWNTFIDLYVPNTGIREHVKELTKLEIKEFFLRENDNIFTEDDWLSLISLAMAWLVGSSPRVHIYYGGSTIL